MRKGRVEIRSRVRYHVILSTIAHNLYFESDRLGLSRSISRAAPVGVPGDQWPNFLEGAKYPLSPTLRRQILNICARSERNGMRKEEKMFTRASERCALAGLDEDPLVRRIVSMRIFARQKVQLESW